jgi:ATP-dependent DNA helicase RecQ
MSEDHEYNESVDEAIVSASKVTAAVTSPDEYAKRPSKVAKVWRPSILLFSRPIFEDMALKYPISCRN